MKVLMPVGSVTEPTTTYPEGFESFTPPITTSAPSASAPEVAEWTRSGDQSDMLAVTAEGLAGAATTNVVAYADHMQIMGYVEMVNGRNLTLTLPYTIPSDKAYMLSVGNSNGYGYSFMVNKADAWFPSPNIVDEAGVLSVVGDGLALGSGDAYLYVDGHGWLTSTSATAHKAEFDTTPLSTGTYTAYAHNGHGGKYGWSDAIEFEVAAAIAYTGGTETVSALTQAALETAVSNVNAYGIIQLPEGKIIMDADIELPDYVWLKGHASGSTLEMGPTWDAGKADGCMIDNGYKYGGVYEYARGITISDIKFDRGPGGSPAKRMINISGERIVIKDCEFSYTQTSTYADCNTSGYPVAISSGDRTGNHAVTGPVLIEGCVFEQGRPNTMNSDNLIVRDNTFRLMYDGGTTSSGYALYASGKGVIVEGNICENLDDSDYTDGRGWGGGRFMVGGSSYGMFVGGNDVREFAPRFNFDEGEYDALQPHQNAGEMVLFENLNTKFTALATAASGSTVTLSGLTDTEGYARHIATVVSGRGAGQAFYITDHTTDTITLDKEPRVSLDTTSKLTIGDLLLNCVITDNDLDGRDSSWDGSVSRTNASCPVSIYGGSSRVLIDGNRATDVKDGFILSSILLRDDGGVNSTFAPSYFNLVTDNTVVDCRAGALASSTYQSHGAPFITGTSIMSNVWRDNTGDNSGTDVSSAAVSGFAMEAMVFQDNIFTDTSDGSLAAMDYTVTERTAQGSEVDLLTTDVKVPCCGAGFAALRDFNGDLVTDADGYVIFTAG